MDTELLKAQADTLAATHGIGYVENPFGIKRGTPMKPGWGISRREKWENLPSFVDAADAYAWRVVNEDRRITEIPVHEFVVNHQGYGMSEMGGDYDYEKFSISPNAYRQICDFRPDSYREYKFQFNYWRGEMEKGKKRKYMRLAHRVFYDGTRCDFTRPRDLFAAFRGQLDTRRGYQVHWTYELLQKQAQALPKTARAEIRYDYRTLETSADITLNAPRVIEESAQVGQLFRIGLRVRDCDRGCKKLRSYPIVWRDGCNNGFAIPTFGKKTETTHRGVNFLSRVLEIQETSEEFFQGFHDIWREANTQHIVDKHDGTTLGAEQIYKRLIAQELIVVPGVSHSVLLDRFMTAYEYEPAINILEPFASDIYNGITATHLAPWESSFAVDEIEERVGQLLYNVIPERNYSLAANTEEQDALFN
jgi:hypothetical protein